MTDFIPDPTKNFTPRKNIPKETQTITQPIDRTQFETQLNTMSVEELRGMVMRYALATGALLPKGEDETAQAMLDKLAIIALGSNTEARETISAIERWLDRIKGKPAQAIFQQTIVHNTVRVEREEQWRKLPPESIRKAISLLESATDA